MFEAVIGELKGFEVSGLARAELCDVTAGIGRVRGALDALEVGVAAAVDGLADDGADSESMMRNHGRVSKREASRRKRRARGLANMPNTRNKLSDGEISAEHADALAKAAEATSEAEVDNDDMLLANAGNRPADMAGRDIADWTRRHQGDADRADRHRRHRKARSLKIFDGDDDMTVAHCRTDKVTGEQLRARIDAIANQLYRQDGGRDGHNGVNPRTWEQLRHDALMIQLGIDTTASRRPGSNDRTETSTAETQSELDGVFKPSGSVRNQIVVVADAAALLGDPAARIDIPGVGPVPLNVLERLGCDADIYGHIFGTDGVSLWHGRASRTVSPQQWRTLIARDRGCVLCAAAPAYCQAHHIIPWLHRGPTDIENLVLLCTRHHHELHNHNQTLTQHPDKTWHTRTRAGPKVAV